MSTRTMRMSILGVLAAGSAIAAFGPAAPASASCTMIEGTSQCLESVPCKAYATAAGLAPESVAGRLPDANCIM